MLVLNARISIITLSNSSSNIIVKKCLHLEIFNVNTNKLNQDVYIIEEMQTNIP